jgi:hypothetical protein
MNSLEKFEMELSTGRARTALNKALFNFFLSCLWFFVSYSQEDRACAMYWSALGGFTFCMALDSTLRSYTIRKLIKKIQSGAFA